jgi:hypothetical protein
LTICHLSLPTECTILGQIITPCMRRIYTCLIESNHLYFRPVLHDVRETGAGIPMQALPITHFIILTYVFTISFSCYSPPYSQPSGRSLSSAHQQYVSPHLSSHGRAPPGRISPLQRIDHNTSNTPIQPRFLGWARNPFFNMQNRGNDKGIELHERRAAVVDVPLAGGKPVSSPFLHLGHSTLHISCRGTTHGENWRWSERKQRRRRLQ